MKGFPGTLLPIPYKYILGDDCLTTAKRNWYECVNDTTVTETYAYPGYLPTDPKNIHYWIYTHCGVHILWIITIILILTPEDFITCSKGT